MLQLGFDRGVSHGTVITCGECEGNVVVQDSFAILPFDDESKDPTDSSILL